MAARISYVPRRAPACRDNGWVAGIIPVRFQTLSGIGERRIRDYSPQVAKGLPIAFNSARHVCRRRSLPRAGGPDRFPSAASLDSARDALSDVGGRRRLSRTRGVGAEDGRERIGDRTRSAASTHVPCDWASVHFSGSPQHLTLLSLSDHGRCILREQIPIAHERVCGGLSPRARSRRDRCIALRATAADRRSPCARLSSSRTE